MKILDKEVEFDFYDYEQAERLEKAVYNMQTKIEKVQKETSTSKAILKIYNAVYETLVFLFGKEIADSLELKKNLRDCIRVCREIVVASNEQDDALGEDIDAFNEEMQKANKYSSSEIKRVK